MFIKSIVSAAVLMLPMAAWAVECFVGSRVAHRPLTCIKACARTAC